MKQLNKSILLLFLALVAMISVTSCSNDDEPEMPQTPDFVTYKVTDIVYNDNELVDSYEAKAALQQYGIDNPEWFKEWYTKEYFKYYTLTFFNNGRVKAEVFPKEEMYAYTKSSDENNLRSFSFIRKDWDGKKLGKIRMQEIEKNVYNCDVTDTDICNVTFNVTLTFVEQEL